MAENITIMTKAMKFQNGCLLLPATNKDKILLNSFCESLGSRYARMTASFTRSNKSYDQVKTVFALVSILFECNYDRVPNSSELDRMYRDLLEEYGPREPSLLRQGETVAIPLSRMSKIQAAEFINALINLIMENCDLSDKQQIDVKQIFEEFQSNNFGAKNPTDYHKDGTMLTVEEWRKKNNFSFASGVKGTVENPLHLHHIVTKKPGKI